MNQNKTDVRLEVSLPIRRMCSKALQPLKINNEKTKECYVRMIAQVYMYDERHFNLSLRRRFFISKNWKENIFFFFLNSWCWGGKSFFMFSFISFHFCKVWAKALHFSYKISIILFFRRVLRPLYFATGCIAS